MKAKAECNVYAVQPWSAIYRLSPACWPLGSRRIRGRRAQDEHDDLTRWQDLESGYESVEGIAALRVCCALTIRTLTRGPIRAAQRRRY